MECEICGLGEAVNNSGACMFCFLSGRYFDKVLQSDERSNMLTRIRETPSVVRAEVFHMVEGMFTVYVQAKDGRVMVLGGSLPLPTGDGYAVMVAIPPVGAKWAVAVTSDKDANVLPDEFTDEGVVEAIAQMVEFDSMIDKT